MLQRERRYPARMTISLSAETRAAIDAAVKRHGIAPGVLRMHGADGGASVKIERRIQRFNRLASGAPGGVDAGRGG